MNVQLSQPKTALIVRLKGTSAKVTGAEYKDAAPALRENVRQMDQIPSFW